MKIKIQRINVNNILRYALLFLLFIIFNSIDKNISPFSASIFTASVYLNGSIFVTAFLYILSFIVLWKVELILPSIMTAGIFIVIKYIYSDKIKKTIVKYVFFCVFSLIPYLLLNGLTISQLEKKGIVTIISSILSLFSITAGKAFIEKGLNIKYDNEEIFSIFALSVFFGIGFCNFLSPYMWKAVAVFSILILCFFLRFGLGTLMSLTFGISLSIYFVKIEYLSIILFFGLTCDGLNKISRYLSAIAILPVDYIFELFFNTYNGYTLSDYLPIIIGSFIFIIIPSQPLIKLKEKLYGQREKQLVRQTINRNRLMLSNKLYELSGVFTEISSAFNAFNQNVLTEDKARNMLKKEITSSICKNCANHKKCLNSEDEYLLAIDKMISIGFAKGRLSLIDFPKYFNDNCIHPNNVIFGTNKMLAEFREYETNYQNLHNGRKLLADESIGVSEILRGLAFECGTVLKYQSRVERELTLGLQKKGINISETLIFGEKEDMSISLIITMKEYIVSDIINVINTTLQNKFTLVEKNDISDCKIYLLFKIAKKYDAVFGISRKTKDGSIVSGDTHSISKISDSKFLVALSDGMGSGEKAQSISSISLSLIESFYKAGMTSNLILGTVNKLLSINTEDLFTALDIAVVNLETCSSDFIKYGAPYSFIINNGSVKIVEGNNLPLGIIDDLKPYVCHTELNDGDIILLITDGISDVFGSSNELLEYLRKAPFFNPQTLTDSIMERALELSNDKKKDDMTAMAIRIFKT